MGFCRSTVASHGSFPKPILESRRDIDLLVSDVGLPNGMNGRQLADAMRFYRPDLKVLFITGFADSAVLGNDLLAPGMQVMTKPFPIISFADKVKDMIEGYGFAGSGWIHYRTTASSQPAAPQPMTTSHGGSFQNVSATSASSARPKSCGWWIALVHTG
jgi:DNA-binding LytR/AlgR family response regulator